MTDARYFGPPIQVLESRKGNGEQQNLGQGLQVFKYTIGALTQGQGEFTKMVCRLLKRLMRKKIQLISMNRAISVLTRLQVLQVDKADKGPTWLGVCGTTERNAVQVFWKMWEILVLVYVAAKFSAFLVAEFSAVLSHSHFSFSTDSCFTSSAFCF